MCENTNSKRERVSFIYTYIFRSRFGRNFISNQSIMTIGTRSKQHFGFRNRNRRRHSHESRFDVFTNVSTVLLHSFGVRFDVRSFVVCCVIASVAGQLPSCLDVEGFASSLVSRTS